MYTYSFVLVVVLSLFSILSWFIRLSKKYLIMNSIVVGVLVLNFSIIIYLEYTQTFGYINTHDFDSLYYDAQRVFNRMIYNFVAVGAFFVLNTILIYLKLRNVLLAKKDK